MNTDVEDLLREGMERFTADLRAPAGLTRLVTQRRSQRLAHRSMAGAMAALAVSAVAVVAVVVPDALHGATGQPVVDTAYVVKRVDSALSAAGPNAIAQMTITTRRKVTPSGKTETTTAQEWSYGDQWRSMVRSATGQPIYDEGFSSSSVFTLVGYLSKEWARQSGLGQPSAPLGLALPARKALFSLPKTALSGQPRALLFGPGPATFVRSRKPAFSRIIRLPRLLPGCVPVIATAPTLFQPGLPGVGFSGSPLPGTAFSPGSLPMARALRAAISCGVLSVAGHQRIDGIESLELKSSPHSPISETIWVTPGTYLPLRVVVRSASGAPAFLQTADITWLRPTAQNLAKLSVPIPAGFRQVTVPEALLRILQQVPGGAVVRLCPADAGGQGPNLCFQRAKAASK